MILSILICTLPSRANFLSELNDELVLQISAYSNDIIEAIANSEVQISIGEKRNKLLQSATGRYVCFIDDDDMISEDYIQTILNSLKSNPDCLSLRGIMTTDGENPEIFEHSIRYNKWETVDASIKYLRYPNHLNVIHADIAKQFKFPEKNYGEDHDWSRQIHESGLLKNEVYIDKVLYFYKYRSNK